MSLFSEGNIIIEGMVPYTSCNEGVAEVIPTSNVNCFSTDHEYDNGRNDAGRLTTTNGRRVLEDWNSTNFEPPGTWNTVGRLDRRDTYFDGVGFGAEGMMCGSTTNCNDPSDSIADGRFGYDSTTGPLGPDGVTANPQPRGKN